MFSRMRPYELYFWQPTGLKSMRDGYRCYTQPVESYRCRCRCYMPRAFECGLLAGQR